MMMSKRVVEIPLEEFEALVNSLKECLAANKALNEEIREYNKKFADKGYKKDGRPK
jgi:hypothetical protein